MAQGLETETTKEEAVAEEVKLLLEKIAVLFNEGKINVFQLRALVNQSGGTSAPPGKVARGH